jgi:hypothetical protein
MLAGESKDLMLGTGLGLAKMPPRYDRAPGSLFKQTMAAAWDN